MTTDRVKWTRDEIRVWVDDVATHLEEWDAVVGDPPEGSDLADLKRAMADTANRLSRFSFSLVMRGMEAADPE
jgi:hypothetical protein